MHLWEERAIILYFEQPKLLVTEYNHIFAGFMIQIYFLNILKHLLESLKEQFPYLILFYGRLDKLGVAFKKYIGHISGQRNILGHFHHVQTPCFY